MEISQDIQNKLKCSECDENPRKRSNILKCSECDEILSCGPVYLLHSTGGTICGRCSPPAEDFTDSDDRTRNDPYEATASLLAFPCAFSSRGCPEKLPFSLGQPSHELYCKFRPLTCPIAQRGSCDWIGSWLTLKEHCANCHESNILENKCNPPRPDLTNSNLQNYLISAFNFLFLLQIKVCVTSGKLFHSLRMFGDPKFLDKFSFTLEVVGNNIKFSKLGTVLHAGILEIQEPTAICTTINNLLGILDGKYDTTKFTITIKTLLNFKCVNCLKNIDYEANARFCGECEGRLVKCNLNGNSCLFADVNCYKCWTHENMFCVNQTKCYYCGEIFFERSFVGHLFSLTCSREIIKSNIDSVARVTANKNSSYNFVLFLDQHFGTIVCENYLTNSRLYQYFYTSLPSHEVKNFKCSIELTDPQTQHTQLLTPQIIDNNYYDWYINETINSFPSITENIGIDMKLNIEKKFN